MPEIISTGTPSADDLKQNPLKDLWEGIRGLDRFAKLTILTGILLAIFGFYAAGNMLETRQSASGEAIARVDIDPGELTISISAPNKGLSALAYDFGGNPIWDGVFYEWSMSSTNSVGTLTIPVGNITEFDPLKVGYGDLHVLARVGDKTVEKSIQVRVTNPDGSIPPPGETTPTPILSPTPIASPTPKPVQTLQLTPVADSYVRSSSPKTNFRTSNELWMDGNPTSITYIKFDLTKLSGKEVLNAKFRVRVANIQDGASKGTFRIKPVADTSWGEKTIKYNNKPALGSASASFSNFSLGQNVEVDLTNLVKSNAGNLFSIGIDTGSSDGSVIRPREATSASNRPTLIIEYE